MPAKKSKKDKEEETVEDAVDKVAEPEPAKSTSPANMNPGIPDVGNACPHCGSIELINKGPNLPFRLGHITVSSLMGNKHGIAVVMCAKCLTVYGVREE